MAIPFCLGPLMRYLLFLAFLGCADISAPAPSKPDLVLWGGGFEYVPSPPPPSCYWITYDDGLTWVRVCP